MSVVMVERTCNGTAHVGEVDYRHIKPSDLRTPDDCAVAIAAIDEIIGGIQTQLRQAACDYHETGERPDSTWHIAAQHALKRFKIRRNEIQERKGQLSKELRALNHSANSSRWEYHFVDAARLLLDQETFDKLRQMATARLA